MLAPAVRGLGDADQPGVGDAAGRLRRSHCIGLADPSLHRSGRALPICPGEGPRAAGRRTALRHVRGRVHPRGRSLHVRGAAGQARPERHGADRHRRDRARHRPEGRQSSGGRKPTASRISSPACVWPTRTTRSGWCEALPCSMTSTSISASGAADGDGRRVVAAAAVRVPPAMRCAFLPPRGVRAFADGFVALLLPIYLVELGLQCAGDRRDRRRVR